MYNVVSLGFVTGLDYPDPRLDPQRVLQQGGVLAAPVNYPVRPQEIVRALRQPGQERALRQVEIADLFAEICLGSALDAVGSAAEVDLVQIRLEDLFFRKLLVNLKG